MGTDKHSTRKQRIAQGEQEGRQQGGKTHKQQQQEDSAKDREDEAK